jgi:hypothetical protein
LFDAMTLASMLICSAAPSFDHVRSVNLTDASRARLAHDGAQLVAEDVEHDLDALLSEGR